MNVIYYWQKLSKRLIFKTTFSHLLLGVIAVGFGSWQQNTLSVESSTSNIGIIAITQDYKTTVRTKSQNLSQSQKHHDLIELIIQNYHDISPSKAIRLSSLYNGIRAGPSVTI
ncbi:hypothetical protein A9G34_08730 [Gilliamella sp. Choc4-2]|uniref:hypothetical protein n=1 Tax=unclassified Gilliamella TaxID=2685620 RepID=UPI0004DCE606|nr:hypothetical protein [Gilliamella apicola]KFA59758.1 hypothetical protein GAPWKB11_0501 [Gilliamella apicola]OCG29975.1 hypothetical protein A9G33_08915 [Gilliamella apicola]OCG43672.1 hypothetical protein A9G34_08730 [Gilliamella apicola]OCG53451.1 hypothetical protein A9G36_01290 [Gilliamella apicola]OCG62091.1 hypothetical protein A9G48_09120 [Gilliamella apicola]